MLTWLAHENWRRVCATKARGPPDSVIGADPYWDLVQTRQSDKRRSGGNMRTTTLLLFVSFLQWFLGTMTVMPLTRVTRYHHAGTFVWKQHPSGYWQNRSTPCRVCCSFGSLICQKMQSARTELSWCSEETPFENENRGRAREPAFNVVLAEHRP